MGKRDLFGMKKIILYGAVECRQLGGVKNLNNSTLDWREYLSANLFSTRNSFSFGLNTCFLKEKEYCSSWNKEIK